MLFPSSPVILDFLNPLPALLMTEVADVVGDLGYHPCGV